MKSVTGDKNLLLIFLLLLQVSHTFNKSLGMRTPLNTCPNLFQYRFNRTGWYGLLQLNNSRKGKFIHLEIILSLQGKLQTKFLGAIELLNRGPLQENNRLMYKIYFPLGFSMPKITHVFFNNRLLCLGPPNRNSAVMTVIHLEHIMNSTFFPINIMECARLTESIKKSSLENQENSLKEICGRTSFKNHNATVEKGSWPWLAAIYIRNLTTLSYQCGGSLVSSKIIISSAHCFWTPKKIYNPEEVIIMLGKYTLDHWTHDDGSISIVCDKIYIHPDFDENLTSYDADIALLYVENRIEFTNYIWPVCLWSQSSKLDHIIGEHGVLVGWGINEIRSLNPVPMKSTGIIVSNSVCLSSNSNFQLLISNRTFCAGEKDGTGPCNGDSGIGFMIFRNQRWVLRGIVSASLASQSTEKKHCNLKEFIIYADVAQFLDWIYTFLFVL